MTTGKDAFDGDELVTETYRELGVEETPERLNQSILRMAAEEGKQPSARGMFLSAWMKPVAWAATIGLSLAIVLELTQVPTATVLPDEAPAALIREEAVLHDSGLSTKTEKRARQQSASSPSSSLAPAPAPATATATATATAEISAVRKKVMVSDLFSLEQSDIADSCGAAARLASESWLECIEKLRQSGSEEAADREYEAFVLQHTVDSGESKGE